MTTFNRFYSASAIEPLSDVEFAGIAADDGLGLDGNVWVMAGGLDIAPYRDTNAVLHRNHDPLLAVGTCPQVGFSADGHQLLVRGRFAEPGLSAAADECRALLKAGILRGLSCGIDVIEAEPLDPKKGSRGGLLVRRARLLEISVVSVPASPGALVTMRSAASRAEFFRAIGALPATPQAALTRAAAMFSKRSDGRPPSATITTWALLEARRLDEEESRRSHPARLAEIARLRAVGRNGAN
jgi:HK97 family phage prohead protease